MESKDLPVEVTAERVLRIRPRWRLRLVRASCRYDPLSPRTVV